MRFSQPRGVLSTARGKAVALARSCCCCWCGGRRRGAVYAASGKLPPTGAISMGVLVAFDRDPTGRESECGRSSRRWAKAKPMPRCNGKITISAGHRHSTSRQSTNDQTDAESQIYIENAGILLSNQPY